jgi:hypothetical protein
MSHLALIIYEPFGSYMHFRFVLRFYVCVITMGGTEGTRPLPRDTCRRETLTQTYLSLTGSRLHANIDTHVHAYRGLLCPRTCIVNFRLHFAQPIGDVF